MTLTSDVITRCVNDYLLANQRERRNVLAATIDGSATTLTFTYDLKSIQEGARLSLGLEDMFVFDVNTGAKTATVLRADAGSTNSAHTAGEVVLINARFTPQRVLAALNATLGSLSAEGLYRHKQTNITYTAGVDGYDVGDSSCIDVWDVRADTPGPEKDWPAVPFRWESGMPTTGTHAFASGVAVFPRWGETGRSLRVFYRSGFSTLSSLTDNVETTSGLWTEALDLLALGAAIHLVSGQAVRRARPDAQGDTRRAEEVTVNDSLQSVRGLLALYDMRLKAEKARMARRYPPRLRV